MRLLLTAVTLVAAGMGIFEVIMDPGPGDRVAALVLFGSVALGITAAARLLPRLARRVRSLRVSVVVLGVASLAILQLAVLVAGSQMFISQHDIELLMVLIGYGLVASIALALTVSGPLTDDLARIGRASSAIAAGDLAARTGVSRLDEVGRLARDIDAMADLLEQAAAQRSRDETTRRALFAAISHDLRTPLASMQAVIEALQDGLATEPERYVESLEADLDALSRLVDDIFLLARLESGDIELEPEVVDLTEIVDEAIEVFRPLASAKDVDLELEADTRVTALGSPEALARVVRNLMDNAIRHSPRGGHVVVAVDNGAEARCRVTDQGAGFSPDFLIEAFEQFSRNDPHRTRDSGGAGLGLAIARSYIDALDGDIWVEPGPGGLVSFSVPTAT